MFMPIFVCGAVLQEKKYSERVMLIYDGLHYDALAVCGSDYIFVNFLFVNFSGCQCGWTVNKWLRYGLKLALMMWLAEGFPRTGI